MSASTAEFGARLSAWRTARALTQEQLGEGLAPDGGDLGKGAVSSWEVGRTQPSASQLAKLCLRLGCTADELLGIERGHRTGGPPVRPRPALGAAIREG